MIEKLAIPETVAELQELMADQKKVGQIIRDGQLEELVAAYTKATDERGAMREMILEAVQSGMAGSDAIKAEVKNTAKETFAEMLKEHGVNRPSMAPPTPQLGTGAELNAAYNPLAPGVKMNEIGFVNLGDFARTTWYKNPQPDDRLEKARTVMNTYSSVDPSTGGFLIPETFRSDIFQIALEQSIVRPRATVITMTSLTQVMPFVDSTTNVGSVLGGMVFYWTAESGSLTATQAKFGRVKLEANKLTGRADVPNELFADAPALNSFLLQSIPRGLAYYEDTAFFSGTGVGEPLGFLNSTALIAVTKDTGQTADTITVNNVLNMYSRMLPSSLGGNSTIWIANQNCFKELMTLSISVGVGGAPVMLVDISAAPRMTLLGRPLFLSEKVPTLGDQGDLCFVDLSYYLIGDRQAVTIESSEHARFANDETVLRVIERVDGRPWVQSAFQPANGDTVSPFVAIAARA